MSTIPVINCDIKGQRTTSPVIFGTGSEHFILAEDTMIMQHSKRSDRDAPRDFDTTSLS